ncbi:MAG: MFS transporter [Opitutaceae bacterium]
MIKTLSPVRVYWTAFIGLFFDYYDLFLFIYLEKVLAGHFGLSDSASSALQFTGLAGVGLGALVFGYLADRFGRGRIMLAVFGVYLIGVAGLSLAWNYPSLVGFRLLASLALGAEWGISHTFVNEQVGRERSYRFAALLQLAILGGLLAALANKYLLPVWGWRWLFAASLVPVAVLSLARWRMLAAGAAGERREVMGDGKNEEKGRLKLALAANGRVFLLCFALASLTIASGLVNVFFAKELPQTPLYIALFWLNLVPGMLLGVWIVRRGGVRLALVGYAVALIVLSLFAWGSSWEPRKLVFALTLPALNGIPFGLMGAYFNEVFGSYRTMLSGAAYNLGRILAGFSPVLITALGLHSGGNYFLFSAALGLGVLILVRWLPANIRVSAR